MDDVTLARDQDAPTMTNQRWTFLCVSEDESPVRQFTVTQRALLYLPSWTAGVVAVMAALAMIIVIDGSARVEVLKVQAEKDAISREVEAIRARVSQVEGSLDQFIDNDERFRLVAGLDPIDAEIFEVGVGGPGLTTLESDPMWETDPAAAEAVFSASYDLGAIERRASLLSESMAEAMESLLANYARLAAMPSIEPTAGTGRRSSSFSQARLHPIYDRTMPHLGMDLAAVEGAPILAAADGVVIYAGYKVGYGRTVDVDHGFGFMTRYAHASRIVAESGQEVSRGDFLAYVGDSGTATASHLHYEVWVDGVAQDPTEYILLGGVIP